MKFKIDFAIFISTWSKKSIQYVLYKSISTVRWWHFVIWIFKALSLRIYQLTWQIQLKISISITKFYTNSFLYPLSFNPCMQYQTEYMNSRRTITLRIWWYIAGLHFKIWVIGGWGWFSKLSVNHILLEQYTMQNTWFLLGVSVFWVLAVFDWGCCTVLDKCSLLVLVLADIVPSPVALGIYN